MRSFILSLLLTLPLAAQQPAAKPADTKPADAKAAATPSPVPASEEWLTGYVELGYRWQSGVGGSVQTYRSVVDLGSGVKLTGLDFTITDRQHRFFDTIGVRASDWGDDPYSTLHVEANKRGLYRFSADYRSLVFFDNMPSFADPSLSKGVILNEQSYDTRRHLGSYDLEMHPGSRFVPYFSYQRDSSSGRGVGTFVNADANEYAIPRTSADRTSLYRGGIRMDLNRFRLTLEEGGTSYHESENVYLAPGSNHPGDTSSKYFGQSLYLSSLLQSYGITGNSTYTRVLLNASPFSWLDLNGNFLYSEPSTKLNYFQSDTGNLALPSQALIYSREQYMIASAARLPHTTGSASAEIRPFSRLRILQSWLTDRQHNASSSAIAGTYPALLSAGLAINYNQQETNVFFSLTPRIVLRGGYRYVWGDGNNFILPAAGLYTTENGKLSRNVGLFGASARLGQKLSFHGDVEVATSGGAYFTTSLYNYQKVGSQARYQLFSTLNVSANISYLSNKNPLAYMHYSDTIAQEALSVEWVPANTKHFSFLGSYERSAIHSDIDYLVPQTLTGAASLYHENSHSITALFSGNIPITAGLSAKVSAGGSAVLSSGTSPNTYYQPLIRATIPLTHHVAWFGEWRYYGLSETFFLYESFRTHIVTTGLRFTR
jgi:hypothetical protein